MINTVIFDFDGTLIYSEEEKSTIFVDLFCQTFVFKNKTLVKKKYRELVGKKNLDNKINAIVTEILQRNLSKKEIQSFRKEFLKRYITNMKSCPIIPCINTLKIIKQKIKYLFIVSLEDELVVCEIAKHCGIHSLFDELYGGPNTKEKNLEIIAQKYCLKPKKIAYVGDSLGDFVVSKNIGLEFFGISNTKEKKKLFEQIGASHLFESVCETSFLQNVQNKISLHR